MAAARLIERLDRPSETALDTPDLVGIKADCNTEAAFGDNDSLFQLHL
jgi:hypothetical protein